ncbi:hypothetical protein RGQ29_009110 [Quercus rubra]|uniref:PGG domain-containing protein n=1 Tax=Quercus rubra TaxID=3512 RepID=A0AAN7E2B8_QUERU|nr:hypothetical protein RGQ29_009110 [Quercus rubra]
MEEDRPEVDHDGLALNLNRYTVTGDWGKVVEMYKQHTLAAIEARINTSGDTALHVAVSIASEEKVQQLVRVIIGVSELGLWTKNNKGNTPLHVAASTGRLNICILLAAKLDESLEVKDLVVQELFRNKAGESPLFLAAFHASDKDLKSIDPAYRRNDGETALHCAIRWEYFDLAFEILQVEPSLAYAVNELGITPLHLLASKPSVFKSGSHLGWWKSIIYYCIYVEELEHETVRKESVDLVTKGSSVEDITHKFSENYQTCIAFYQVPLKMAQSEKTETVILLAARNGITEMVEYILKEFPFPMAIDNNSEGQNIVLLAVKNRQTHVLQLLLEQEFVKRKLIHEVDTDENNALHLAAQIGKQRPWLIPGAALQMQWEIKWYEFVKDNMPQHFCYQVNKEGKTPEEIFSETHEDLVKQGGEWLNKTSESCSVVAALIATVAFASSTTIPGNINEENGKPNLESHSMLTVFAASSLIALCFSITALFSFLAILTSRYEQKDFRRDLPKKLLLGLTSLLVSITSMLVSFCAGHYFMLKNKLKDKAFPVYAATSLPIIFFAIQQLPLYIDIVWASFKNVPRSSYKAISL